MREVEYRKSDNTKQRKPRGGAKKEGVGGQDEESVGRW